jgi:two-component system invasion response regulator UvrY
MIRIAIADDHAVVREGIRRMLDGAPDFEVVAEAANGSELLDRIGSAPVDVAVVDFAMPDGGIELIGKLRQARPEIRTLVFSVHPEEQYAIRCLRAGAAGYLAKNSLAEYLEHALETVASGRTYIGPAVAETLAERVGTRRRSATHERLSTREYDVFIRLAEGEGVVEIANRLGLSVKSVSTYRSRVLEKLGLKRNADLTRYAVENSLIE